MIAQEKKNLDKCPPLDFPLVKDFVGAAHAKLEKTKEMLAAQPALLNAAWDWAGGDFETALSGAVHMGNREIAEFLIAQGAGADIFALAMLGQIEAVKEFVKAFPGIERSLGPHKIPLLVHAQKGGERAAAVVTCLQSFG